MYPPCGSYLHSTAQHSSYQARPFAAGTGTRPANANLTPVSDSLRALQVYNLNRHVEEAT